MLNKWLKVQKGDLVGWSSYRHLLPLVPDVVAPQRRDRILEIAGLRSPGVRRSPPITGTSAGLRSKTIGRRLQPQQASPIAQPDLRALGRGRFDYGEHREASGTGGRGLDDGPGTLFGGARG